jgi:hypothetical protein
MTERELREIVVKCWRVAGEAELGGVGKGMIIQEDGKEVYHGVRYEVFRTLLLSLIPKATVETSVKMTEAKEDWQE